MTAVLNVVKEEEVSVNPLLVQFTNGDISTKSNGQLSFTLYKSTNTEDIRKKFRKTLVAKTDKMKYYGNNFGMTARSNSLCKYLVGVYNKKSGTMDVYDTTTFRMQPKISTDEIDAKEAPSDLSFMEKNDRLVEAFGSTRRKRAMKSRLQNVIDSQELGHSVSGAVSHMIGQPEQNGEEASSNFGESDMLPRYKKDGQTAAEIYPISSLLSKDDLDALKSPAIEMLSQLKTNKETWRRESRYCQYILDHLDVLPLNENDRIHKASCLLYFSYLLKCYQLTYKLLKVKDPMPDLPTRIKDKIFSSFSLQQKNTRCIPKRLKDKLVCYMIVLALIIDGYTIDCMVLCKDLKMALQR
ncbi:DNA-directed RNA polymerase I subunit RPA49-like isoform X2 [Dendronephthya gigantea]|nr:DNA-directed RNA polymerase I subunit RPA49-like isoform X2 [Dendronephthya gigantea]